MKKYLAILIIALFAWVHSAEAQESKSTAKPLQQKNAKKSENHLTSFFLCISLLSVMITKTKGVYYVKTMGMYSMWLCSHRR